MCNTRNLLKIAFVANIFEWYEFIVYVYLANVIGQTFFNTADSISGLIKAFAVFAVGYIARPFGSLFFGVIGDRLGRAYSLKISLMMMATPAAITGLLPTYHDIGWLASALLLVLRLIQGFAMGGELPTNGCYIFETSAINHRSLLCSVVIASQQLGALLASLVVFLLFQCFDHSTISAWAWRLPFLLGIPILIGIILIRSTINAPILKLESRKESAFSALKKPLIKVAPIVLFLSSFGYLLLAWMPSYLIYFLNYPTHLAQLMNTVTLTVLIVSCLVAGYVASFITYQKLIKFGIIATCLFILPLWLWLQQTSLGSVFVVQLLLALLLGSILGVSIEMSSIQFPPSIRCRGMNLADTFPTVLAGSITPLVCTWGVEKTGLLLFPAFYLMFFGLLALPAALRLKSTHVDERLVVTSD